MRPPNPPMIAKRQISTQQADDLVERLGDEADLCRNDGANDIADLLDEAAATIKELKAALVEADRKNEAMLHEWNAAEARADKAEEALRKCRFQFAYYAELHRNAGKDAKAATNQHFADICSEALGEGKA